MIPAAFVRNVKEWKQAYQGPQGRAGEIFLHILNEIDSRTDQLFYYLLLLQYPAAIVVALIWSPLAWAGTRSSIHSHVWLAFVFGGILTSFPLYLVKKFPGASITRHSIAAAQMLMGTLLIHLSGGRIETHFHIFGSLAFLSFYRDIKVLATATVVASVDHLFRGIFYPQSVYGVVLASNWRFAEHAFWICFENSFLAIACVQGRGQVGIVASQQAELEATNEKTEAEVERRTDELRLRNAELATARDAALESTRLKSQFLANVSHEIRTPMNGVLGMTSLLLETPLTPDQQDCALTVQRSGEALLTIINDILDFSKIEAGKLVLERVPFLPNHEVDDVVRLLAHLAEKKGIELICDIDSDVPSVTLGDAGRLRQILMNLIGNAIKFTEQGEVIVRVKQVGLDGVNCRLRFEVADTGSGIPEAAQKRLFEAFVQVDGSTTRRHEGTGLGLAISRQLVQLMSGEIGFDSVVGVGSSFWFEVPLEVGSDVGQAGGIDWHALAGMRVLVVDDNQTNRMMLLRIAESWGIIADQSAEAHTAIDMMEQAYQRKEPFDVVLMDFQMPSMDGLQAAKAIWAREHLRSARLIMLTSQGQRTVCSSLESVGISACMVKPIRREHLFLMMLRVSGRSATENSSRSEGSNSSAEQLQPKDLASGRMLRVLVAEDNRINQRIVSRMLSLLGHQYDLVTDGDAAVLLAQTNTYDLILMDCQMPGKDGFEASMEIRRLPGAAGEVAIVALTANAMSDVREKCLDAGMTGCLTKPIRLEDLAKALQSFEQDYAERPPKTQSNPERTKQEFVLR